MAAYAASLNAQAVVRDYVVNFISSLPVTNVDSVKLQASTMSHLTDTTSELTRQSIVCLLYLIFLF